MTTIYEKLRVAKNGEMVDIASQMATYISAIDAVHKEAEEIMEAFDSVLSYDDLQALELSYSKWKSLSISNVLTKEAYDQIVIALCDRYDDGKKSSTYDNSVRYSWNTAPEKWGENIEIHLTVKTTVTGCKLVKVREMVPEKIVPAHEEVRTEVKCSEDENEGLGALFG
jgi:hypothetical protein